MEESSIAPFKVRSMMFGFFISSLTNWFTVFNSKKVFVSAWFGNFENQIEESVFTATTDQLKPKVKSDCNEQTFYGIQALF
jgi:hypothetical protein